MRYATFSAVAAFLVVLTGVGDWPARGQFYIDRSEAQAAGGAHRVVLLSSAVPPWVPIAPGGVRPSWYCQFTTAQMCWSNGHTYSISSFISGTLSLSAQGLLVNSALLGTPRLLALMSPNFGTVYASFNGTPTGTIGGVWSYDNGTANRIDLRSNQGSSLAETLNSSGGVDTSEMSLGTASANASTTAVVTWGGSTHILAVNGLDDSRTSFVPPVSPNEFYVGDIEGAGLYLNQRIRAIGAYPVTLTQTQATAMSQVLPP